MIANCKPVFRRLLGRLKKLLAANSDSAEYLKAFEEAIVAINSLQEDDDVDIDTNAREELCEAIYYLGQIVGINPKTKFIDRWRDW